MLGQGGLAPSDAPSRVHRTSGSPRREEALGSRAERPGRARQAVCRDCDSGGLQRRSWELPEAKAVSQGSELFRGHPWPLLQVRRERPGVPSWLEQKRLILILAESCSAVLWAS